jgi:phosphoribosylpyrophosphate synthetase
MKVRPNHEQALRSVDDLRRQLQPGLTREICAYIDIPPGRIEAFKFSNENIFVRIGESVRENDVFVIQPLSGKVNESIMELLIIIDTLKRSSAGRITAVIPYFGYGREPIRKISRGYQLPPD